MKTKPDRGASIHTQSSVYDGKGQRWTGIDHASPDELIGDVNFRTGCVEKKPEEVRKAEEVSLQSSAWKCLVRYVWHNARSVAEACVYFGVAVLHLEPRFENRMQRGELGAIARRGKVNGQRHLRVFRFHRAAVYRTFKPLTGYTPLCALLEGEHGEAVGDWRTQAERRGALLAIVRAAWQDIDPGETQPCGRWETSLRAAFTNFTALAGEDRALLAFIKQTEFAAAFEETRAAMCARRKRRVRRALELNGYTACTAPGGKSEAAIARYSKVQEGNHNRAGFAAREPEEREEQEKEHRSLRRDFYDRATGDVIPIRVDLPRDPKALRAHLRALADRAEERRLAALCGCDAQDISIAKTKPDDHHERRTDRASATAGY